MATFISHSPEETAALGETWGREARAGWVIGLAGGLGAGKTVLAAGIARGLGVTARVNSPTFQLVNDYSGGRLPFVHLDLYRLNTRDEIIAAGLEQHLRRPAGVAVVEWFERWSAENPPALAPGARLRRVTISSDGDQERKIVYEDFGD